MTLAWLITACTTHTFDIIIKNGQIADGTGNELFEANIYIRDGKIVTVGNLENAIGTRSIDAT